MGLRDLIRSVLPSLRRAPVDLAFIDGLVDHAAASVMARSLDVGETPAWTDSWSTTTGSLNQDLERHLVVAVKRSRDLTRNNDYGRGFIIQMKTNILGATGMRLQMRMRVGQRPNRRSNEMLEAWWAAWGKRGNCEVTGKLSWRQCEQLLLTHWVRDGEILVRLLPGRGPMGFMVQILDPLILDANHRGQHGKNRIRMGVEIDADNRPVAYWLRGDSADGDYFATGYGQARRVRVPAEEIIHHFIVEEADQLRGLPWLVAGARRLWLMKDYEQAAAVASSNAAKRVGFFVSPNGAEAPAGFADQIINSAIEEAKRQGKVLSPTEVAALVAAAQKFSTVAPGQYDTLPQGYDFKAHDSQYPHINYGEYIKECMRGFTYGVGISYVTGGNNLEAVNFSSAQVGILNERELFKLLQEELSDGVSDRVFSEALKYSQLVSPLLAGFSPTRYAEACDCATWSKRRWAPLDPLKAANSNDINLKNRLTSPQRIIAERGDDPDEIAEELEQWEALYGPIGGNATPVQQALANDTSETDEDTGAESEPKPEAEENVGRHLSRPSRRARARALA